MGRRDRRGGTDSSADDVEQQQGAGVGDPLELEGAHFERPDEPTMPPEPDVDELEPPEPTLIEWTPERAGAVVRIVGFGLHVVDPVAREPGGEDLWRATEADADAIGTPLARILNRYAPARRLAGVADEGELGFAVVAYATRNMRERGRVIAASAEPVDDGQLFTEEGPPGGGGE